jgi:[ribosomal protein S18]-alanine N-acetyltransferase
VNFLALKPLTAELIPAAVKLDQQSLGGLWTQLGYERELESPNSDLLVLQRSPEIKNFPVALPGQQEQDPNCHPKLQSQQPDILPILGLGCLWAILEEAHITLLIVDPAHRRQGLGQAMLYVLMQAAWQRKLEWATLEVRVSNQPALALYQKFGFEEVGQRRRYYQDTGEDARILWYKGIQKTQFHQQLRLWNQEIVDRLSQSGWAWAKGAIDQVL